MSDRQISRILVAIADPSEDYRLKRADGARQVWGNPIGSSASDLTPTPAGVPTKSAFAFNVRQRTSLALDFL